MSTENPMKIMDYLLDMENYFTKQAMRPFLEPEEEARIKGQKRFVSDLIKKIDDGEVL